MRKVWYHQIWIQNNLGFIVSDLKYIPKTSLFLFTRETETHWKEKLLHAYIREAINFPGYNWFDANWIESNFDSTQGIYVFSCRFQIGKGAILHSKQYWYYTHCPKMKINDKKLSKFQFHFPRLLVACPMLKKWKKNVPTASWDNLIYPISNPDGQDQEDKTFVGRTADFS